MTHDEAIDLAAGYVLGALEPAEEAAVREHLATLPSCRTRSSRSSAACVPALQELGVTELVEPPAALRDRILAAAAADLTERTRPRRPNGRRCRVAGPSRLAGACRDSSCPEPIPFPSENERTVRAERRRSGTSRLDWAIRIAAVVAIVALGAWGYQQPAGARGERRRSTRRSATCSRPRASPARRSSSSHRSRASRGAAWPRCSAGRLDRPGDARPAGERRHRGLHRLGDRRLDTRRRRSATSRSARPGSRPSPRSRRRPRKARRSRSPASRARATRRRGPDGQRGHRDGARRDRLIRASRRRRAS